MITITKPSSEVAIRLYLFYGSKEVLLKVCDICKADKVVQAKQQISNGEKTELFIAFIDETPNKEFFSFVKQAEALGAEVKEEIIPKGIS